MPAQWKLCRPTSLHYITLLHYDVLHIYIYYIMMTVMEIRYSTLVLIWDVLWSIFQVVYFTSTFPYIMMDCDGDTWLYSGPHFRSFYFTSTFPYIMMTVMVILWSSFQVVYFTSKFPYIMMTVMVIYGCSLLWSLFQVVYFTSTFPYIMMTVMVIRGCTLEGASLGLEYYLKPDFSRLADSVVSRG